MSKAAEVAQAKPEKVDNPQPTQAENRIDSNQLQVNDTRGLQAPQPKSAEDLSGQLNALYNAPGGPERFDNINKDLATSFKSVYDKTPGNEMAKQNAVKDFEGKINDGTVQGKGILAQFDKAGNLTVRHVEATTSGEKHPEFAGVFIKDIGNKMTTDLKTQPPEKRLEQATGGSSDKADTKQFPSDVLFQKAMTASPEWAKAKWDGVNAPQKELLNAIKDPAVKALADSLPPGMLDAAAGNPKQVNDFLEKKGFGRLLQETNPKESAVAATLSIQKDWTAEKTQMQSGDKTYSSVDKDGKVYNVDGKKFAELYKDPTDGITVYAIPNKPGMTGEQAMKEAKNLIGKADAAHKVDEGIIRAPMIDLSKTEDLNWLKGMHAGQDLNVRQAKMQTMLKMDENGFDAKQALAMSATRGLKPPSPEPKFQLNTEFTFVVAKDGKPLFAIPVEKEDWKDPKRR